MKILDDFIALFFPRYCVSCRESLYRGESYVCAHCLSNVAKTNSHQDGSNVIEKKFYGKIPCLFACSYWFFKKQGIAQRIIYYIKYKSHDQLAIEMGKRYGIEIKSFLSDHHIDYIVPVPLHLKGLRIRGYNQSSKIAIGLSEMANIPFIDALKRTRQTTTQTKKNRIERWNNVEGIFQLKDRRIVGKRIALVDDVVTTGATVEACAKALADHGCQIGVLSLAVAT